MAFTTSYSFARSGYFRWQYSNTASTSWGNDNIRQGNFGKHEGGTGSGYWSYCGIIDVSEADKTAIKKQYATAYPTKIELTVTRASAGSTGSTITNARVGVGQGLYNSVVPSNQQSYISATLNGGSGTTSTITLTQAMADYYCSDAQGSTNRIISFGHIPDIKTTSISTPYTAIATTGTMTITWETRTCTISYNGNGGTGAPAGATVNQGATTTISSVKPTRTGHKFLGWSTSSTATSATYTSGQSITVNSNLSLYAVWQAYKITITYQGNGGVQGSNPTWAIPYSHSWSYGQYTETGLANITSFALTKEGYTYTDEEAWNTKADGTGYSVDHNTPYYGQDFATDVGKNITSADASITLYANWKPATYTITLNPNGGTVSSTTVSVTYNSAFTLPTPTKSGSIFNGWYYNGVLFDDSTPYTIASNITLTASWDDSQPVSIYIDTRGGTPSYSEPIIGYVGETGASFINKVTVPTKPYYTLLGYCYENGELVTTNDVISSTEPIHLYVKWALTSMPEGAIVIGNERDSSVCKIYVAKDGEWKEVHVYVADSTGFKITQM